MVVNMHQRMQKIVAPMAIVRFAKCKNQVKGHYVVV